MSFWEALPAYAGTSNQPLRRIQLNGRLNDQFSPSNPQGPALLGAAVLHDVVYVWDTNEPLVAPNAPARRDNAYVYWLPWLQYNITGVTFDTLNASGCDYFLTSEFSGCRFVVGNDRLQHVAYGAGSLGIPIFMTSASRDTAMFLDWGVNGPSRARTYSYSKLPSTQAYGSAGTVADGYGAQDAHGNTINNVRATVIGKKVAGAWYFYMQMWVAGEPNATFKRIGI